MQPLRYSINVTLDGCCDHQAVPVGEDVHQHAAENIERSSALLFGRKTYQLMVDGWTSYESLPEWMHPFGATITAAKKYVVSSTLTDIGWNAEVVRGDLRSAIQKLKDEPGDGLLLGGVRLPLALAELGLIDEYEFVVHPRIAGHGPTVFAPLSRWVDLELTNRIEFDSGAVALRYVRKG